MTKLPSLPKVRDLGGDEFEKLMHQLLLAYAERHKFEYEPHGKSGAAEDGIDGLARQGAGPGLKGPAGFQFKWLSGNLSKGGNAKQITKSLTDAEAGGLKLRHWVLVTPENITPAQKQWLLGLSPHKDIKIHHWGHVRIASLFRLSPELLAEYYPETARTDSANKAQKKLLSTYLAWLIKDCAPLKLRAIDQGAARSGRRPLGLTSVYVDHELTLRLPQKQSLLSHLVRPRTDMPAGDRGRPTDDEAETRRVAVLEALGSHPRFVLLGAPGSGKSTLTAYLALSLAEAVQGRKKSLDRLGPWWKSGALLPVRVVLREFAASLPRDIKIGRAQHVWDFLEAELERSGRPRLTATVLRQTAADSGALFLFDGLDEAREASTRERVLEAVTEFASTVGDECRFLLTTRPYAWEQATAAQAEWSTSYRLAEFSSEQIDTFIGYWFEAVWEVGWIGKAEADEKPASLRQAIRRADIHPLASNPLLLTLMATLLANRMRLPDDRADLYDEVVSSSSNAGAKPVAPTAACSMRWPYPASRSTTSVRSCSNWPTRLTRSTRAGKAWPISPRATCWPRCDPCWGMTPARLTWRSITLRNVPACCWGRGRAPSSASTPFRTAHSRNTSLPAGWADQPDFCERAVDLARANPGHWREVLTFAARQAKVGRGVPAADALVHCQPVVEWSKDHEVGAADWRAAVLAGEQLLEIGLAAVGVREEHPVVRKRVAGWLGALLQLGALSVAERAKAGMVLGRLGDERSGIGAKNGVPEIDWITIPRGPFTMGEGGEEHSCDVIQQPYAISRYPVTVAQYQAFLGHTSAVGMFPNGHEEGAPVDMAGNAWEWTRSLWGKTVVTSSFAYPYTLEAERENLDAPGENLRVLRGGSWYFDASFARCAIRFWYLPDGRFNYFGFRVVASPFLCSER